MLIAGVGIGLDDIEPVLTLFGAQLLTLLRWLELWWFSVLAMQLEAIASC